MSDALNHILQSRPIEASAPCRIDMGGTLDIPTFFLPLRHLAPCTLNIAIALRTRVRLLPFKDGMVRISSKGFEDVEYPLDKVPFAHPLGLMFAVAAYFRAGGIHIDIDSSSPPRSGLGGSSVAAVALVAALAKGLEQTGAKPFSPERSALLAHALESSVAGVPCGFQDQLAAAYGGVNAWFWKDGTEGPGFEQKIVLPPEQHNDLEKRLLIAYCGAPHESKDVNGKWVQQFLSGQYRDQWAEIILLIKKYIEALSASNYKEASLLMNRETAIRREMTPDVLDDMGEALVAAAVKNDCGARFTGAGGGGCIWALGDIDEINCLKGIWEDILVNKETACLLDVKIDPKGVEVK
jgi:D-glycero-alpha-D-manno-heptose-7-phosphate kinase